jgi:hypothetical protein
MLKILTLVGLGFTMNSGEEAESYKIEPEPGEWDSELDYIEGMPDRLNQLEELPPVELHIEEIDEGVAHSNIEAIDLLGEDDGTVEWHYQLWEYTGEYPENVGYVVLGEDQETYIIGLVENTDEAQSNLRALFPESENVEFEDATYSYNELMRIQQEITDEWIHEEGIYSIGIGWGVENGQVIGFGPSGNESRVVVSVNEEEVAQFTELFESEYGESVYVESSEGVFTTMTEEAYEMPEADFEIGTSEEVFVEDSEDLSGEMIGAIPPQAPSTDSNSFFQMVWITVVALAIFILYFLFRSGRIPLRQMVGGGAIGERNPLTRKEVKGFVKESSFEPSEQVYYEIKEKTIQK